VKGKVKVVPVLFNWAPHHEGELGSASIAPHILDLGTRWRWVVSFTPRERVPDIHWTGSWMGPRTGLEAVLKRKFPSPCRESNPRTPVVQPVAQPYTTELSRLPNMGRKVRKAVIWVINNICNNERN
jgi:hypothetical protein